MIRRRVVILGALSSGLLAGCTTSSLLDLSIGAGESEIVTGETLGSVNRLRVGAGLPRLSADRNLGRQAEAHAQYMARKGRMSHDHFEKRMRKWKVDLPAAENVSEGQHDIAGMFEAFATSPKHRENMLVGKFRKLGVAVASNSEGRRFWVMGLSG
ncbi:MAG: secretion protein [Ahrensia sp.]|nr:secretion protein [Ahrensia sp.]